MSEDPKTTKHEHPITICLDFDGVCNTYDGWKGEDELFEPLTGLRDFLLELRARGYQIFVFSTRGPEKLAGWFHDFCLNHLVDGYPITKPPAVLYLDDRGIRFNGDFDLVLEEIDAWGTEPWWHPDGVALRPGSFLQKALDTEALRGCVDIPTGGRPPTRDTFEMRVETALARLGQQFMEEYDRLEREAQPE